MTETADSTAMEANRLYWETDHSVADIAQQLDISRRALYNAVQPLSLDSTCDVCGGVLVYENRSARTSGQPACPACADADSVDDASPGSGADHAEEADPGDGPATMIAAAALAGAVIGAAVTLAVVPRR